MNTPTQPDPLDDHGPDWLVELLGEHTSASLDIVDYCGCGDLFDRDAIAAHVAEVVWAALTDRMHAVTEVQYPIRSHTGRRIATSTYFPTDDMHDALLDALGGDHD